MQKSGDTPIQFQNFISGVTIFYHGATLGPHNTVRLQLQQGKENEEEEGKPLVLVVINVDQQRFSAARTSVLRHIILAAYGIYHYTALNGVGGVF